ncbi:MAG TPA: GNAT family N-acetyltransferase [Polyangiaceae bacterium]
MTIEVREADLSNADHARGLLEVLDGYARGDMGGGAALEVEVRERLVPALRSNPAALVLLALSDGRVVGVATCFFGFSTFRARSLLNVHDLAVLPEHQGQGIGAALLAAAEERALARDCCKLTLEVREDNARARRLYARRGFADFELAGQRFPTLFLSKQLSTT